MPPKLILARHADKAYSNKMGFPLFDPPLSSNQGLIDEHIASILSHISESRHVRIVSSPMLRARMTAAKLATALDKRKISNSTAYDARISEYLGNHSRNHIKWYHLITYETYIILKESGLNKLFDEPVSAMTQRADDFIRGISSADDVIVVSHRFVISKMLDALGVHTDDEVTVIDRQ